MKKMMNVLLIFIIGASIQEPASFINDTPHLYAPWRTTYASENKKQDLVKCHMCRIASENPGAQDFLLLHTDYFVIALNVFPYSQGHILLIPRAHIKKIQDLSIQARTQLGELIVDSSNILESIFKCTGFNVGYNQEYNSGASLPDHLHIHIVPRYANKLDSFMSVIANTRVIEWDFHRLQSKMLPYFATMRKKYASLSV